MTVMEIEPSGIETGWTINIETEEIECLKLAYPSIEEGQFQTIINGALNIMSNFPEPSGPNAQTTGLAIGKIQSGKTLSFSALIALAASNGYRLIIVLAGTKNPLRIQTQRRLERDLGTRQDHRASRLLVLSNPEPTAQDTAVVRNALSTVMNKTVLIVCLKHKDHIDDVRTLLSSPEIPQLPTLIIDDEGDEASHNRRITSTRRAQGAAHPTESATHRCIRLLRESLRKHVYLAYTATPQANLLIPRIAELSPNFFELINPGPGYCGGSVFFGDNIDRYVMHIDEQDAEQADGRAITPSLERALSAFFVSAAIRHIRAPHEKHTMLIHTDLRMDAHAQTRDAVLDLLDQWQMRINTVVPDQTTQDLMAKFQESYREFQNTVRDIPSLEAVMGRLQIELLSADVHVVNSLQQSVGTAESGFRLENNIVIGGNMLGRGVTIENLAITYITRMARNTSNADTMEQRARWFGYKEGYLDLCRIWMTDRLRATYEGLLRHEDDFWMSLERHMRQGIPIAEWPRFFDLDRGLRLTRTEVARGEQFDLRDWTIMRPIIPSPANNPVITGNLEAIDNFIEAAGRQPEPMVIGNVEHQIYKNVPLDQVIEMLVSRIQEGKPWEREYVSEYLLRLQFGHILDNIDVVLMRANDDTTHRNPNKDTGRINPMQGRNRNPGEPNYYPGDRGIHGDRPQLQIHRYRYGKGGPKTCSLSLYLPPEDDRFNLSYIVGGEDI